MRPTDCVFPVVIDESSTDVHAGLQFRDYLAAQAMTGSIAGQRGEVKFDLVAYDAYAMDDAMITERDKKKG